MVADDGEVEKWNLEPRLERRTLAMNAIEVPVDFGAVVEILIAKQTKTMLADFVCLAHDGFRLVRQMLPQQFSADARLTGGEKELSHRDWLPKSDPVRPHSHAVAQQIASLMELLPAARANFFPVRME
jgi:hypothetical protein